MLESVRGVGRLSSAATLRVVDAGIGHAHPPRGGSAGGVAPMNRDSGGEIGRRTFAGARRRPPRPVHGGPLAAIPLEHRDPGALRPPRRDGKEAKVARRLHAEAAHPPEQPHATSSARTAVPRPCSPSEEDEQLRRQARDLRHRGGALPLFAARATSAGVGLRGTSSPPPRRRGPGCAAAPPSRPAPAASPPCREAAS